MTTDVVAPYRRTCGHDDRPQRRFMNFRACADCTPAKLAGHPEPPEPVCAQPLICYRSCCVTKLEPVVPPEGTADEQVDRWKAHARAEIMVLAGLGYPFGPADLAALLPLKLAGESARDWLKWLLEEGITAGAIVEVAPNRWKGARA